MLREPVRLPIDILEIIFEYVDVNISNLLPVCWTFRDVGKALTWKRTQAELKTHGWTSALIHGNDLGENYFLRHDIDWIDFSTALERRCAVVHPKFVDYYQGKPTDLDAATKYTLDNYFAILLDINSSFSPGNVAAPDNFLKLKERVCPDNVFNIYSSLKKLVCNDYGTLGEMLAGWKKVHRLVEFYGMKAEPFTTMFMLLWMENVCNCDKQVGKYFEYAYRHNLDEFRLSDVEDCLRFELDTPVRNYLIDRKKDEMGSRTSFQKRNLSDRQGDYNRRKRRNVVCHRCNIPGHIARECRTRLPDPVEDSLKTTKEYRYL
ncbi:hypothetical protein TRVA0_027S00914 [Trichomonascus vanleenenianus]|uniref:zinc finger CCHC domain-containing protein n=1 Tax=Trichomonascus vanleenenianus TaxID=2268995 RepID=UPI003ECA2961